MRRALALALVLVLWAPPVVTPAHAQIYTNDDCAFNFLPGPCIHLGSDPNATPTPVPTATATATPSGAPAATEAASSSQDATQEGGGVVEYVRRIAESVLGARAAFSGELRAWRDAAIPAVGDAIGQGFTYLFGGQLRELRDMDAVHGVLRGVPARWTYESPTVWVLWGTLTAVFLGFAGAALATNLEQAKELRGKGALYEWAIHGVTQSALGVVMGLTSPGWAALGVLFVAALAAALLGESTALPGMAVAQDPDAGLRNGALLGLYAVLGFAVFWQRLVVFAVVGLCLATSGWGIGAMFSPRFKRVAAIWEALYVVSLLSLIVQIVLFRLGTETINDAVRDSQALGSDGTVVGMGIGVAYLVLVLSAPMLLGGAYAVGAIPSSAGRLSRIGRHALGGGAGARLAAGRLSPAPPRPPAP